MSVETIYKVVLHPFIKESIASLQAMTSLDGEPGDAFMDKVEDFRFKGYAVCTDVQGGLNGVIMMHHYPETAVAIGNSVCETMFEEKYDFEEINEDLGQALAEWGNTIVGRSTDILARHNLGFKFSHPYFIRNMDDMGKYLEGVKEVVTVAIKVTDVGRYYFNLLVRDVNFVPTEASRDACVGIPNPYTKSLPTNSKVLVVDDSAMIRKALKRYLDKLGYAEVIETDDGAAVVDMVKQHQPDFIFMDVVMARVNGDIALKALREQGFDVPVVMLSSVTDQKLVDRCQELGVSGFVFKPIQADNGVQVIKDYLKIA